MALTDVAIRKAEPRDKPYKMADGAGLYLYVTTTGAKSWRFKYRFGGAERLLTFGLYPEVKLIEARGRRDDAREKLRRGIDPGAKVVVAQPFRQVGDEWHDRQKSRWSAHHAADVLNCLQSEIYPAIGNTAIDAITVADVRRCIKAVEDRGALETAHRTRQRIDAIFKYAIAAGMTEKNPGAAVVGAMRPKPKATPQPAITDLDEARAMLKAALAMPAQPVTREAVLLLALLAVRPGELRKARWQEFDLRAGVWTVPAERMKGDLERKDGPAHIVFLPAPALAALDRLDALTGGAGNRYVFPSIRHATDPMSENAIGYLLNRAGYHGRQTAHGFRATFSTIMNERFPADRAVIDAMLAHKPSGVSGSETAYNRAGHLVRRRELADAWAALILAEGKT